MEAFIRTALQRGGYYLEEQALVTNRLGGGRHKADFLARLNGECILVSAKWQQTSGTAEQKVPYEYMCLAHALSSSPDIHRAYIVIGGNGWTKHEFFLNDLADWVDTEEFVDVVEFNDFIAKANRGNL
tara:strand:- start:2952 stop:3335 length:384 start_codon:yes stop_codon:yes gene_type:complete